MNGRVPGESWAAPDIAGTIDAWRVWRVVARDRLYLLGSVIKPTLWPPRRPLLAECLRARTALDRLRRKERHAAPQTRCECGLYAAQLGQLGQYLLESSMQPAVGRVIGQVALWGTVVECERGFRASHAYPLRIFVPTDVCGGCDRSHEVVEGLAAYAVPVELLNVPRAGAVQMLARQAA